MLFKSEFWITYSSFDRAGIAPAKLVPPGQVTGYTPLQIAKLGFARGFAIHASLRVISVSLSTPPINSGLSRMSLNCGTNFLRPSQQLTIAARLSLQLSRLLPSRPAYRHSNYRSCLALAWGTTCEGLLTLPCFQQMNNVMHMSRRSCVFEMVNHMRRPCDYQRYTDSTNRWPIHCAICGTTAFPSPRNRSIRLGIPSATRPTAGSCSQWPRQPGLVVSLNGNTSESSLCISPSVAAFFRCPELPPTLLTLLRLAFQPSTKTLSLMWGTKGTRR